MPLIAPRRTALAAIIAAAACSSDTVGGAIIVSPAAGTYALQTVNGTPLPAPVTTTSRVITFLADTLRLGGDGSYTEFTVTQSAPPGQTPTKSDTLRLSGRWVDNGTSIGLDVRGGALFSGGNTLTLTSTVTDTASKSSATVTQVYVR